MQLSRQTYGVWRTDKAKEPGFSHELISQQYQHIEGDTSKDELVAWPYPDV